MDILTSLLVVAFAGLIHASFQLSISVLTLLSGHAIGAKHARSRVLGLTFSFVGGVTVMTLLLLSFIAFILVSMFGSDSPDLLWSVACGLTIGVGVAVWLFYYRREKGTALWVPRGIAHYLSDRTKATKHTAESFGLGMMSVVGELLFIIAPLFVAALVLSQLDPVWQLLGVAIYVIVSILPLKTVWMLISGGNKISDIQKWRESNKYFLQFVAGAGLIILGVFTYVCKVVTDVVIGM